MLQQVMTAPGVIQFREVPTPQPQPGEVLVKIMKIGVCGSDIPVYHGEPPFTKYPLNPGQEVSGGLAALGEGVTGFTVGQKVTIQPQVVCGKCWPCRHGKYNLCEELKVMGFQTTGVASHYFAVDAKKVTPLPEGMSFAEGAMIEPLEVAVPAVGLIAGKRGKGTEASGDRPELTAKTIVQNLFSFVLGAAAIVLGAQLLIDNGSALAQMIGVPDSIIAATMIAIGTSLPELVTTLTAIRKKESSLSVGNIIGANIMDLTLIMPLCALIQGKPMMIERQGMLLDIPACLVITAAALVPALVSGRFKRWMGFLIGGLYIAYLVIMFTCFGV